METQQGNNKVATICEQNQKAVSRNSKPNGTKK